MPPYTQIAITPNEAALVVAVLCEHMEELNSATVQAELAAAAAETPSSPVILDMSNVRTLASMSIGTLMIVLKGFQEASRGFSLAGLQPRVRQTLALCRLDRFFDIHDSVQAALAGGDATIPR